MRKYVVLWMAMLLVGTLFVGCDQQENANTKKDFVFVYKDVEMTPHGEAAPIITKLGKPISYYEFESCAFDGKDKRYQYDSIIICTYSKQGADYIYTIQLKDDLVETREGVYIGMPMTEVWKIYGEPTIDTGTCYVYQRKNTELSIMYEGENVTDIVYGISTYEGN